MHASGAGEMAQKIRALTAFAEHPHIAAQRCL